MRVTTYSSIIILLSILFYGCQQDQPQTDNNNQTNNSGENLYYDCMENKIVIEGKSTVQDNERGQWSVVFDGKLMCESTPIPNADINVKFPVRETNLTIKTKDAGEFTVKLSRLEEDPAGKEFTVTLMGTNEASIQKTFKVE